MKTVKVNNGVAPIEPKEWTVKQVTGRVCRNIKRDPAATGNGVLDLEKSLRGSRAILWGNSCLVMKTPGAVILLPRLDNKALPATDKLGWARR